MASEPVNLGSAQTAVCEAPLRRITLKEQVVTRLRTLIMRGVLQSGQPVTEAGLAQLLGVSRTPVREAMVKLAGEGLLDYLPSGGARVRVVTDAEQAEVFLLRQTLETLAVNRLSASATDDQLDVLQRLLDQQAELVSDEDRAAFLELDEQFHLKLAEFAGLVLTQKILRTIRNYFYLLGLAAIAVRGRSKAVVREHQRVVDALRVRNAELAIAAITEHLAMTRQKIESRPPASVGIGEAPPTAPRSRSHSARV